MKLMKIGKERKKRYAEKFELIEERLEDVEFLLKEFEKKYSRLACYKAFQEAVELLFDIMAMCLRDMNKVVEDDYVNVEKLAHLGIISRSEADILKEANGLRNRIVHKYNKTDDEVARESMQELLPKLKSILRKMVKYL